MSSNLRLFLNALAITSLLVLVAQPALAAPAGGIPEFRRAFDQVVGAIQSLALPLVSVAAMLFFGALALGMNGHCSQKVMMICFGGAGFIGTPAIVTRFFGAGATF